MFKKAISWFGHRGTKYPCFVCIFCFQSWYYFQLGFHLDLKSPNLELHVPFGFFRIGWDWVYCADHTKNKIWGKRRDMSDFEILN